MNKLLFEKFTSKILTAGPILQFLLIVGCNNVHFYSSNQPSYNNLFTLINLVGTLSLFAWMYSIAYVANFHIVEKEQKFEKTKLLEGCIILFFFLDAAMTFFDFPINRIELSGIYFTYNEPFIMSAVYVFTCIFSIIYVAKILIYAETHKEVSFGGYYKTALLLFFPIVGIWLISSRLEKLKHIVIKEEEEEPQTNAGEFDREKYMETINSERTLTKIEYKCKEGILAIYQEYPQPNIGEKAFLNNKKAGNGKYKIGFMSCITVEDGRVLKLGMF